MIIDFEWWHVNSVNVQQWQRDYVTAENYIGVQGPAFTYAEGEEFKACFGMQIQWEGRAIVWAIIGDVNNWPTFHREVSRRLNFFIGNMNIRRCEMTVQSGFKQASRWAKMLGFHKEALLKKYFAWGEDAELWVRIYE